MIDFYVLVNSIKPTFNGSKPRSRQSRKTTFVVLNVVLTDLGRDAMSGPLRPPCSGQEVHPPASPKQREQLSALLDQGGGLASDLPARRVLEPGLAKELQLSVQVNSLSPDLIS